jgi:hypothetical protein
MKQCLIAIAMVLTLSMNANAAAQKHRHTPRTEQVDTTKNNQDAIEAFSDTTNVANSEDAEDDQYIQSRRHTTHHVSGFPGIFNNLDGDDIAGMLFVLLIILIMFLAAPIGIIIAIFYFVNKNRREKYKLAQMAMQNGQPIPDQLLKENTAAMSKDDYDTGLRQMFTGVGLAIFLGIIIGKLGIGIGALVFFIGLGKWYVARQARNDAPRDFQDYNNYKMNNNEQETDTL